MFYNPTGHTYNIIVKDVEYHNEDIFSALVVSFGSCPSPIGDYRKDLECYKVYGWKKELNTIIQEKPVPCSTCMPNDVCTSCL